jgi:hypothetical protein
MFKRMREYFSSLSEAQQAVNTIFGVVMAVAAGWAIFWKWIGPLDWVQKLSIGIAVFCLLVIFITAFITWWKKRNIEKISSMISQLDEIVRRYVGNFTPEITDEESYNLSSDLGDLFHFNVTGITSAIKAKDKRRIAFQMEQFSKKIPTLIDPEKRTNESLKTLMLMAGLMNDHHVGLNEIKNTPNYQIIYDKIKALQQIVPNAETNIKINNYFNWSDGLYSLLLSIRFISDKPEMLELMPAEGKATKNFLQPLIEGNTATLISAVRESIEKNKVGKSA